VLPPFCATSIVTPAMVRTPLNGVALTFATTSKVTVSLPTPWLEFNPTGVIQVGIEEIFHWQVCALALTVTYPVVAELTKVIGSGLYVTRNVHALVLDWVTATVVPPTSTPAVFTPPDPLPAAVTVTVALPVPLVGETESQFPVSSKIVAVHAQLELLAASVKVWLPPLAMKFRTCGVTVNEQALVPASEAGIDSPATASVPDKLPAPELGKAVATTVPVPVPLVWDRLNQFRGDVAVHAQVEGFAMTVRSIVPPVAGKLSEGGETE
jgi:hypothetical protein